MSTTATKIDKATKVRAYLEWITSDRLEGGGLESTLDEPRLLERAQDLPWSTDTEVERAAEGVKRLQNNEELSPDDAGALEAIVLPKERPVVDVIDGTFVAPGPPFEHLGAEAARATIEGAIPAIGRVEIPDHPSAPYAGTAFVVGDGLLMTNRHVAELFALGIGRAELSFRLGQRAAIDFLRERDRTETLEFQIVRVLMVHPYWDMALLATEGLGSVDPLRLSIEEPGDLEGREVAVIGYPALDPRNEVELQNRIFGGVFNVKRLQPGKLRQLRDVRSFGHDVRAVTHDSSTLGGNSGSAVIDIETGAVVGLHFAGRYLEANFAVPTRELALDGRVVDTGVNFGGTIAASGVPSWSRYWDEADPTAPAGPGEDASVASAHTGPASTAEQTLNVAIPLEITVRVGSPAPGAGGAVAADAAVEAAVEPFRDQDYSSRKGYDDTFLGLPLPLPTVRDPNIVSRLDDDSHVVPYEHFSVVVNRARRLALYTASNVDASPARKRPEEGRDYSRDGLGGLRENDREKWFLDPRIPALHQLPDRFFEKDRKSFDKGHIVRREDVAWGDSYDELRRANGDTYHVTNCSPQIATFNRSNMKGRWGELENLILKQAKAECYTLFAGPVFRDDDRIFRGVDDDGTVRVGIPRQFWKIVVARVGDELQTFAFLLDQDLSGTDLEFLVDEAWRSRMISIPDLEELVGLIAFPAELHDSDRIDSGEGEAVRREARIESVGR